MRAVFDTNVLVSAAISATGAPASLIRRWRAGEFELVVSPALLDELSRVLDYPKIRRLVTPSEARLLVRVLEQQAVELPDPEDPPPIRATDPDDDYLIALAAESGAALISGDRALLDLAASIPVFTPADFEKGLEARSGSSPGP